MNPGTPDMSHRIALTGDNRPRTGGDEEAPGGQGGGAQVRPWIGVQFVCAAKYVRVFRRADGSGYLARCPTCGNSMWFRVGPGGTGERFFEVTCRSA